MKLSHSSLATLSLLLTFTSGQFTVSDPSVACQKLGASLNIENVTVNFAEYVPAGTNIALTQDYDLESCGLKNQAIFNPICRVAMSVATSNRSGITLEAWLPTNWTGRFLSAGNGGLGGCIQYYDLAYTSGLGFAAVGANDGKNGTSGAPFYNNMDIVHDFADRSLHTGVVVGKEITKQFYGTPHNTSYYLGCSTGGRQGFKSVQDYPEDFDGVVAGAPAVAYTNLTAWSGHFFTIFGDAGAPTSIPVGPLWTLIHEEVLKQCDGIDGVVDGIIEDPLLCQFQPGTLQCATGTTSSTSCLTAAQVGAVKEAFSDYIADDGSLIYPRMQPGSEISAQHNYYTGGLFQYTLDWYRYVVYENPTWNPSAFTATDAKAGYDQNPFDILTWNGDLSAFKKNGGKILHYHGQEDPIISSDNSPRYYNHVSDTMGLKSSELDNFYRFFRISGMGHCGGGEGAHMIGQGSSEVTAYDSQHNVLLRMVDWVENGNAPDTVTGTKYVNDTAALGVDFVRNHCKYPLRNYCIDPANYKSPDAWNCIVSNETVTSR